jgi:signal transduction histidine kinase
VKVEYRLEDEVPAIDGDKVQIQQVIMNLVINASDAIGDGDGAITVSTGVRECDQDYLAGCAVDSRLHAGRYVFLDVVDTGCGMDVETRNRIFDPFFTTKTTGRGLGLASVFGIMRGHGGALRVESEPGKGSVFSALFPCSGSRR